MFGTFHHYITEVILIKNKTKQTTNVTGFIFLLTYGHWFNPLLLQCICYHWTVSWGVNFLYFITYGGRIKDQSAYSEVKQVMDPKGQRVKLNDGHFIPVLGFGTAVPPEV